jgi:hypothetical protein
MTNHERWRRQRAILEAAIEVHGAEGKLVVPTHDQPYIEDQDDEGVLIKTTFDLESGEFIVDTCWATSFRTTREEPAEYGGGWSTCRHPRDLDEARREAYHG